MKVLCRFNVQQSIVLLFVLLVPGNIWSGRAKIWKYQQIKIFILPVIENEELNFLVQTKLLQKLTDICYT